MIIMRALITGIDGFVGRYLAAELSAHGAEVFGTTVGSDHDHVRHIELTDPDSVRRVVSELHPDQVYHLAGFTSVKASWDQTELAMRVNRDGTKNLYAALQNLDVKPRVLITSTAEVYGIPTSTPITESHPTTPNSPYAESKLAQERVTGEFPEVPTTIVRSFPHIGPGQSPTFVTSDFARQIVQVERGQASAVHVGNLEARRDFSDVRDVVRAYRLLMEKDTAGQIYNVCSGNVLSIRQVLDALLAASTNKEILVESDPDRLRPSDIPVLAGDSTKLRSTTGWRPEISVAQTTLPEILAYWREKQA
ncbi:NAD-dependent epimerase/dehydratase family protein [Patescibacteria group bacterium]|nr:MAG: NAD-dependent epimerase/dehydratase family protein [Patescibacteria group bacterium]